MQWMLLITADLQPRTAARVLQVLDHHMVPIHSFVLSKDEESITIHALIELESEKLNRIQHLVCRIPSVYRVEGFVPHEGVCRTVALLHVCCDMLTRLPVLQTATALGLTVVSIDSFSVVIEACGSSEEIANLEIVFCQQGLLSSVAKATLGLGRRHGEPRVQG